MYFSSALKQFGYLLYESDDAQTHNIAAQLDLQGVAVLKKALLNEKHLRFEPKNFKKMGFSGFSGLHWNASEFRFMNLMKFKLIKWPQILMFKLLH